MSKPPPEPRDWSAASEALFRSARGEHAPSDAARERVRNALAQRLSEASNAPIAGADASLEAAGKSDVAISTLVKIGLGVALVVTGYLTLMRAVDSTKLVESKPASAAGVASTRASEHAPTTPAASSVVESDAARDSASARVESAGPARTARRSSERASPAMVVGRTRRSAESGPNRTAPEPEAPAVSAPLEVQEQATSTNRAAVRETPAVTEAVVLPPKAVVAEPEARTSGRAVSNAVPDPSDPRAELVFVRRIQSAMIDEEAQDVLELCAEHERRWPHGTFVQERDGLRAIASCESSARDATARAKQFVAAYPRGPLAPRVRKACGLQLKALAAGSGTSQFQETDSQ